jgi:hypothetical protein
VGFSSRPTSGTGRATGGPALTAVRSLGGGGRGGPAGSNGDGVALSRSGIAGEGEAGVGGGRGVGAAAGPSGTRPGGEELPSTASVQWDGGVCGGGGRSGIAAGRGRTGRGRMNSRSPQTGQGSSCHLAPRSPLTRFPHRQVIENGAGCWTDEGTNQRRADWRRSSKAVEPMRSNHGGWNSVIVSSNPSGGESPSTGRGCTGCEGVRDRRACLGGWCGSSDGRPILQSFDIPLLAI